MKNVAGIVWCGILPLLLTACGGGQGVPGEQTTAPSFDLPFPNDRAGSVLTPTTLLGKNTWQQTAGASIQNNSLLLPADANGRQYAIYQFSSATAPDHVDVVLDGSVTSAAWIGVADFGAQHWLFHGPYAATQSLPLKQDDLSPLGHAYIAIVTFPIAIAKVDSLTLYSAAAAPVPSFVNFPDAAGLPLTMDFDASLSTGGITRYEWDMDNDGVYELDGGALPTAQHVYAATGAYTVGLRVTDDAANTATLTRPVEVWTDTLVDATPAYPGAGCSMAIVDGRPAISYINGDTGGSNYNLFFVRASDAAGSSWSAPVLADSSGVVGGGTCLVVVNGNPAISCKHVISPGNNQQDWISYVRATDVDGTAWGTPVAPDSANQTLGARLTLIAGKPALAYIGFIDFTDASVYFRPAMDLDGATWSPAVPIQNGINQFSTPPLLVEVGARPALAYEDGGFNATYVRASDATGASWPTPQFVGAGGVVGLINADGLPGLMFVNDGDLQFRRAADVDGIGWGVPVKIDDTEHTNIFAPEILGLINGIPSALSFYVNEVTGAQQLVFTQAKDASGSAWNQPLTLADPGKQSDSAAMLTLPDSSTGICYMQWGTSQLRFMKRF